MIFIIIIIIIIITIILIIIGVILKINVFFYSLAGKLIKKNKTLKRLFQARLFYLSFEVYHFW